MPLNQKLCNSSAIMKHAFKKSITNESGSFLLMECEYQYPQLAEDEMNASFQLINQDIQKEIIQRYTKNCDQMSYQVKDLLKLYQMETELKPPSWFPLEAKTNYSIPFNSNNIISIVFEEFLWFGGAHPNTEQFSMTYDLCSGKLLNANDLLGNSEKEVKELIASGFSKRYEETPEIFFPEEIRKLKDLNFSYRYYLTEEGIVFYFNPYEIGPYVSGVLNYLFPFNVEQ